MRVDRKHCIANDATGVFPIKTDTPAATDEIVLYTVGIRRRFPQLWTIL
jgi:hypothetical protein